MDDEKQRLEKKQKAREKDLIGDIYGPHADSKDLAATRRLRNGPFAFPKPVYAQRQFALPQKRV